MMTPALRRLRRALAPRPPEPTSAAPAGPAGDRLVTGSSIAVVVAVALGAAYVSYRHAYELVHTHGETGPSAVIGPFTVDGMIYASGMVLLQSARHRVRPPRLAYFGLWLGIVATVGANVAHGAGHGRIGALVSAWPAVALIISYHLLMWIVRAGARRGAGPEFGHPSATGGQCSHGVAGSVDDAIQLRFLHGRDCLGKEPSRRHLAEVFDQSRDKVAKLVAEVAGPVRESSADDTPSQPDPAMNGASGRP